MKFTENEPFKLFCNNQERQETEIKNPINMPE